MYEIFYNLDAEPFRLSPDHRFCYDHKDYAKARAYMAYAFMRAEGFVMITGRPGTGKTTLIGELVESLADENVTTANLVCTQLHADDLLKMVAYSFGVDPNIVEKGELLQRLQALLHKWHRENRRALLIVDEAQDLSTSAMEELRLLTNIQLNGVPLMQIFLLGQPELRELILSPKLEQVHQRLVAASHLQSLECEETEAYVRHRLETVGWTGDPALSKVIFPLIHRFSEGIPRRINLICSRLFLHGAVEQKHHIGVKDMKDVIAELQSESLAAGDSLSDFDFNVEDVYEEAAPRPAPVASAEPPAPLASVAVPEVLAAEVSIDDSDIGVDATEPAPVPKPKLKKPKPKKSKPKSRKSKPKREEQPVVVEGETKLDVANLQADKNEEAEVESSVDEQPSESAEKKKDEVVISTEIECSTTDALAPARSGGGGAAIFVIFLISLVIVGYAIV